MNEKAAYRTTAFCLLVLWLSVIDRGHAQTTNDAYPADLFAVMVPNAIIRSNAMGYSLLGQDGKLYQARRTGSSWTFTEGASRPTLRADTYSSGWLLYSNTHAIGRVSTTPGRADAEIGQERRRATKTSTGYITTTTATNSAELYFQHYYEKKNKKR